VSTLELIHNLIDLGRGVLQEEMVAVEFVVPETQRREILRSIENDGGVVESSSELYVPEAGDLPLEPESRFDPMVIIVAVVSLAYFLRETVRAWHDLRAAGGTIIDFRDGKVRVYKIDSADRGTIVVMTDGAPPSVHRPNDGTDVMQQITRQISQQALPPGDGQS
jgi:hypothetical protein